MFKSIEATGKTLDLAIQAGLTKLQMDRDSVSVEVLEQPRSGFFGIGAVPAKVKLTYEVPDPVPEKKPEPVPQPKAEAPKAQPKAPKTELPKPQPKAAPKPQPEMPKPQPVPHTPAPEGSVEERIETFMKGLMEHMGSDAIPVATKSGDDTYSVELQGSSLGMLIGRRGDTLDAIQHITNYAVNHGQGKRVRINVDAENYRKKREESLIRLANKVAGKVSRSRRNITLEPMNAYERHVIHAALQDYPDVTTYSTGTEPGRRIVVAYSKYRSVPTDGE
ncbi:MAG: RNA-binding cell elongation regulator Jag/EloR [Oscillospiraceae bacterium]|nr:RNA-binding cell elongation regulator Jag/EloR [Oscillospiraceae bacterium]